jgi:hypothetical protein
MKFSRSAARELSKRSKVSRKPVSDSRTLPQTMTPERKGLRKVQNPRIAPRGSFGKSIASVRGGRTNCRRQSHQARLRCATKSSSRRNAEWNRTSTTLRGIPWFRMRSSSWDRSVPHVVFGFWNAQLTNWSNKKQRTELNVSGGQTLLHNGTRMRGFPTQSRLVISIFHGTDPAS